MNQVVSWWVNCKYYPEVHEKQELGDVGVFLGHLWRSHAI